MSETRVVHIDDRVTEAIYIGRAVRRRGVAASIYGNPFRVEDHGRQIAIERFEGYLKGRLAKDAAFVEAVIALRGKPLACWCRHDGETKSPENACHGDILVELLDRYTDDELRALAR